jgi:hypothetical protein
MKSKSTHPRPKYSELVKALSKLHRCVDVSVLNPCSDKEINDSYADLFRASVQAEKLVNRAQRSRLS